MVLALDDKWIWDFWLVRDNDDHHIFYLQADKSVGDPDLRHWHASVGHAVSTDLMNWTVLPDAIAPGPPGAFDDKATWTGSVIARPRGGWAMLYTGTSVNDNGQIQRVGLATSLDLITWTKHGTAVCEADPDQYETLAHGNWFDQAWRDPFVFADGNGEFHALITARFSGGQALDRGTIASARSGDLITWTVGTPVTEPMGLGQLEVPQLLERRGRWYLVFGSDAETQTFERQGMGTGTFYLVGAAPTGPFAAHTLGVLQADAVGSTYAGRLHVLGEDDLVFLAWNRIGPDGEFVGTIDDPRPVHMAPDGSLRVV